MNCSNCNKELNLDKAALEKSTCEYCKQVFCDECMEHHITEDCEPLNEYEDQVKRALISS